MQVDFLHFFCRFYTLNPTSVTLDLLYQLEYDFVLCENIAR
jgi:hypothetical protein